MINFCIGFDFADERSGKEKRYTALATTWLNGERWSDEAQTSQIDLGFGAPGLA